ncbi:hypothetical protein [Streptomyces sp. NPDC023588]|uniref:hypothetical protein n=1 Tax=Streptomyces sp. NPDC023588 TaxID=3154907 RepID=UPI0033C8E5EC
MGGRQYTQRYAQQGRRGRLALRCALLVPVLGVLIGVLFLCARPAGEPHAAPQAGATTTPQAGATTTTTAQAGAGAPDRRAARAVCASPYDLPGCSSLEHVTPGVLPTPPPAVTVAGGDPPPVARAAGAGRVRPPERAARAPDLHALQVLRT